MDDREMFKNLNAISYDDEETKVYTDFSNIDDKKLSNIKNHIKTNLAKEKLREACIHIEENILDLLKVFIS